MGRTFIEAREVLKQWGTPLVHPRPAFIIRVVQYILQHRGATSVAAFRCVRPVTGGEEMHVSAASPKPPSVHRGGVGSKQRRIYCQIGGRRGRGYVEASVFRRVTRETVKAWDRFWDHRRLRARVRRRGCRQPARRRRFVQTRFFLQSRAVKRRGARRRAPPPRGRPDPARLARRHTRGRNAHLPARSAGGDAARPIFYARRRRVRGRRLARRLGRRAAVPGGGGRPRGRLEPLRGRDSRLLRENARDSFSRTAGAPLGGRTPQRARPPRRPTTARPTRAWRGSSELGTKLSLCAGIGPP